jgi:5-methylcytosine-specific restriction endonuclease McrA
MSANSESSADAEWWRWRDGDLWGLVRDSEERRRAEYVRQVEAVAEIWGRTSRDKADRRSMVADLVAIRRVTPAEARELLRHAELFASKAIRGAAREGVLSRQHLNVIDKTLAEAPEGEREQVEAFLLDKAKAFDGDKFKALGRHILQVLDQDGKAPDDRELARPKREFHCTTRRDGSVVFRGHTDAESGATLTALMSAMAKPKSGKDPRTTPERQGDAFAEIIELAAKSDELPEEGGERPHLALTMSLADFVEMKKPAEVEGGDLMDAPSAMRIACDSKVMRVVLEAEEQILHIGRASRTIPNFIRRALIARDKGCAFPNCGKRPRQSHGHHVRHWAQGGETSLDNLVLLCGQHHRVIHHGHWTVTMVEGRPVFSHELTAAG